MALTTDARTEIAETLREAGLPAFAYVPPTVSVPAVIVTPDDPYIVTDNIGGTLAYRAAFLVDCLAQATDPAAGLAKVEDLIDSVLAALPSGVWATRVGRPGLDDLGAQGTVYVAQISVNAHLVEEEN
jgi:hypothetical protein